MKSIQRVVEFVGRRRGALLATAAGACVVLTFASRSRANAHQPEPNTWTLIVRSPPSMTGTFQPARPTRGIEPLDPWKSRQVAFTSNEDLLVPKATEPGAFHRWREIDTADPWTGEANDARSSGVGDR